MRKDEDGAARFAVRLLLRKGLVWDGGLEVHGPFRGPPPADGPGAGGASGLPF